MEASGPARIISGLLSIRRIPESQAWRVSPSLPNLVLMVPTADQSEGCPAWEGPQPTALAAQDPRALGRQVGVLPSRSPPQSQRFLEPLQEKIRIILINKAIFKNFPGSCRFMGRVKLNTTTKTSYQGISLALMFIYSLTSQHLILFWWERGTDNLRPRKMVL